MSSEYLYVKIIEYLTNLKTEHIMAASVIYQGLEDNPWITKDELRGIVERAVNSVKDIYEGDFSRYGKISQIMLQVNYFYFFSS